MLRIFLVLTCAVIAAGILAGASCQPTSDVNRRPRQVFQQTAEQDVTIQTDNFDDLTYEEKLIIRKLTAESELAKLYLGLFEAYIKVAELEPKFKIAEQNFSNQFQLFCDSKIDAIEYAKSNKEFFGGIRKTYYGLRKTYYDAKIEYSKFLIAHPDAQRVFRIKDWRGLKVIL